MTGAIVSVRTPCSIASVNAIAPDGPAAQRTTSVFHWAGRSPRLKAANTKAGNARSFIPVSMMTLALGVSGWLDRITPSANNVSGAAAAQQSRDL